MDLVVQRCSVDPRPDYPLQILANRYSFQSSSPSDDGYTLVFMHATGMHKEIWEVTIRKLFELCTKNRGSPKIRDVFSIESPNHGESAVLNEKAINEHFSDSWPTREYARAAHIFLTAGEFRGANVDFSRRKLVAIGHSVGAAALFLMRDLTPTVTFQAMIVLEPGISLKDAPDTRASSQALTAWTWLRKDVWISRNAAKKELAASPVYNMWDSRVLELFVKYGLREHPAAKYPHPFSFSGVTTSSTKVQEAASYRSEQLVVDALQAYTLSTREIPVHVVWGTIPDVATPALKKLILDSGTPTSVMYIKGAGHLVVQQQPDSVAETIRSILESPHAKL